MVPRKVMATLLLLYMVAMLAKQSNGFISFHTRKAFETMQERERNQAQKKSLNLQQRSDTRAFPEFSEDEGQAVKAIAPVDMGMYLENYRVLKGYQDFLDKYLAEVLPDAQNVN